MDLLKVLKRLSTIYLTTKVPSERKEEEYQALLEASEDIISEERLDEYRHAMKSTRAKTAIKNLSNEPVEQGKFEETLVRLYKEDNAGNDKSTSQLIEEIASIAPAIDEEEH
ncbi:hypothetical protein [Priestia aryabhattai]